MDFRVLCGHMNIGNVPEFLARLSLISSDNGTIIQAMDVGKVAGEKHIMFAVEKALRAINNNCNAAKDPGIEIMRYASGKRQIGEAFSMGVHEGEMDLVFVILGDSENISISMSALEKLVSRNNSIDYSAEKKEAILSQFDITSKEIDAVGEEMIPDLVLERVALVDVLK
ncbi:KEOPS complex subunit Cgi121 [Methanolobus sp. ZRKC2]|uniref:KEOPS complex subunit Cgi121 n=1 Tax=Methanolobus sp. ZRKC2 TaxID=3125783 RepID=UPI003254603E